MAQTGSTKSLRLTQIGKEATKGTAVAATEILRADAEVTLDFPLYRDEHPVGVLLENSGPTPLLSKDVAIRMLMNGATFQQIAWLLSLSIDQPSTSDLNEGASAGPYRHTYDPGIAALWDPHSATLEGRLNDGGNQEDVEIEYVTARSLGLVIERKGQLVVTADLFGRQITNAAITALSVLSQEDVITAAMWKYYINNTWAAAAPAGHAAPSGGLVSNQVIRAGLDVDNGQFPEHFASGNLYFDEAKERRKGLQLRVNCLVNPDAATEGMAAERVHAQNRDLRFITLFFEGILCRSTGATSNFTVRIALAVKHEMGDFHTIGDDNGLDTVEMSFLGHHDPTGAKLVQVIVVNDDSSEP